MLESDGFAGCASSTSTYPHGYIRVAPLTHNSRSRQVLGTTYRPLTTPNYVESDMAKCILGAVMALAISGCGGGDAPADPPKAPSVICTPRIVTVALLGDSTQAGADGLNGGLALHNPGAELQAMMILEFGQGTVVVTDYGVSNTSAMQAPAVVADVVVANYGINDMREKSQTLANFAAQMRATGSTLIETQLPILDRAWPEASFVATAKSLSLPVADVNAYVLALPNWQQYYPNTPMGAGVHPDDALYELVVDNVLAPAVAAQVAPLRCTKA